MKNKAYTINNAKFNVHYRQSLKIHTCPGAVSLKTSAINALLMSSFNIVFTFLLCLLSHMKPWILFLFHGQLIYQSLATQRARKTFVFSPLCCPYLLQQVMYCVIICLHCITVPSFLRSVIFSHRCIQQRCNELSCNCIYNLFSLLLCLYTFRNVCYAYMILASLCHCSLLHCCSFLFYIACCSIL